MNPVNAAVFNTKFNQVDHEMEIYLDSGAGDTNRTYPINPNSIVNLTIEDTLSDWVVKGSITIFFNPEAGGGPGVINNDTGNVETIDTGVNQPEKVLNPTDNKKKISVVDQPTNNKQDTTSTEPAPPGQPSYIFRGDGEDILRIRVIPKLNSDDPDGLKITDRTHWSLSYVFAVYDIEDVDLPPGAQNQASAAIKCLKIYFWDRWYQKMIANTLEYSTALSEFANIEGDKAENYYSNYGVIETGQAMREIIETTLQGESTAKAPVAPDGEQWDKGAAKIFYTAPAYATAYESLMYIYNRHVSTESMATGNDFCLLCKERGPSEFDVGQLTLRPVSQIYDKAGNSATEPGEFQYEHFFLQAYSDPGRATRGYRAPLSENNSDTVDFKSLKYNTISNYRFVDVAAATNVLNFGNTPVYSFDFKNRTFNVEFQDHSAKSARNFISQKYIEKLYKTGPGEKLFLMLLGEDKKFKNTTPVFSEHGDDKLIRQYAGIHKLLKVGIFQNACINFRVLGLTCREPGRFIGIDRTEGVDSGAFEDKFYGQYFVINVKHIFESEFYYNDITAIKLHRFAELDPPFVATI